MVRGIKFNKKLNNFQKQLKNDAKLIRSSPPCFFKQINLPTFTKLNPKTIKLLIDNVTAKYKKTAKKQVTLSIKKPES